MKAYINEIDKIRAIEFDKNKRKIFGIKSAIVWAYSIEDGKVYPLLYISKPKHLSQEDFDVVLDRLDIKIRKG